MYVPVLSKKLWVRHCDGDLIDLFHSHVYIFLTTLSLQPSIRFLGQGKLGAYKGDIFNIKMRSVWKFG